MVIALIGISGYAQINFEKGYYINNAGEKTDCLIKNLDWKNNPTSFEYKTAEGSEIKTATINTIQEFAVTGVIRYKKVTVNIDKSTEQISRLGINKEPEFEEETLFLKVLVDGKASLYYYENGNLRRFFYQVDESKIEQLIYKKYKTYRNDVATNLYFRQQLWANLQCKDLKMKEAVNTSYRKRELIKYFIKYNNCAGGDFITYKNENKKDAFNLSIRPGVNFSSLKTDNSQNDLRDTDFDTKASLRLGVELEYVLPFNNNKWAIILEPTYQSYKAEKFITYFRSTLLTIETNVEADYKSIEIPLGVRHYFFLNKNSKLFADAGLVVLDIAMNSKIDFEDERGMDLEIDSGETGNNFFLGFGYKYKDRYGIEARYNFNRELLGPFGSWTSEYGGFSILLGYTIF